MPTRSRATSGREVDAGRRKFSDFLILTRKKKDRIAPYAEALEALNIPIEVSGAGAFGESREVAALTMLLRALADPQDQLALVAVLRGPLFGISDPELFAFKQAGGWFSIFPRPDDDAWRARAPARPRVATALAALHQLLPLDARAAGGRRRSSGSSKHTGYLALAATTPGGVEAGDLLHAVDRVRQVVEDGGSLADAADALEADSEATSEVESLPLEPGRTDVVRLMNLHKAKGLEADVVFLADPCGGVKPRVDVHIERDGLQARGWFKVVQQERRLVGRERCSASTPTGPAHEAPSCRISRPRRTGCSMWPPPARARCSSSAAGRSKQGDARVGRARTTFLGRRDRAAGSRQRSASPAVAPLDCSTAAQAAARPRRAAAHARVERSRRGRSRRSPPRRDTSRG